MKYLKKLVLLLIISLSVMLTFCKVNAQTLGELKSQLSKMQADYQKNEANKKMTEQEIKNLEAKIDSINDEIDQINLDVEALNQEIEERNQEIIKMNGEIKSITNYYQVSNGDEFYLEYAFKAKDYTDFIYRLAIVEQLNRYLKTTIDKYNELIEQNKRSVQELISKKQELKNKQDELTVEYKKLEGQLTGISIAGVSIKEEIETIEKSIKLYQNTYKCSDSEDITTCVNKYNKNSNSRTSFNVPSAYGFYAPISYWTGTYEFRHHDNGFDLSTPEEQEVHPIADGVVVDIWNQYNCGGNMVWILHTVNGRNYTSAYFHLKTVNVSLDQVVTHNTIIGYSGGAKRGTSTNYYDNCTTGPHLHLQVSYGHYGRVSYWASEGKYHINYYSWNANSFNPRDIINF